MEWDQTIYTLCGHICHQKPDRSLYIAGVQFPLCARCTGIYAALIMILFISPVLNSKPISCVCSMISITVRKLPVNPAFERVLHWVQAHVIPALLHPHLCSQAGTHLVHVPVMKRTTYLTLYKVLTMCILINLITYIPVCDVNIIRFITGSALGTVLGLIMKKAIKTILIKEGQ